MAQYHLHSKIIGRSKGRSVLAAAAYRSGSKLVEYILDKETGIVTEQVWDYSKKQGVKFSCIVAPEDAPDFVYDREKLWNRVTQGENRKDSQFVRDFDLALPIELTLEQNKELLLDIAQQCFVSHGMVADVNMHLDNVNNPHAHIIVTMRDLVKYADGKIDFGLKNREWNSRAFLLNQREQIAHITNEHLQKWGHAAEVSHLSHKDRGIELIPTVHIGVAGKRLSYAERQEINNEIIAENARRIRLDPSLVIDKLSIDKAVFSGEDIEKELHNVLMIGVNEEQGGEKLAGVKSVRAVYSNEELLAMYGLVIASEKLVLVNPCDLRSRTLFARRDKVELEQRIEIVIEELHQQKSYDLSKEEMTVGGVIRNGIRDIKDRFISGVFGDGLELTEQQKEAVEAILSGSNLSVLEGLPGSGKSTVMKVVVDEYKGRGFKVIGTAMTNKASEELSNKVGIEVINTTRLRQRLQQEKGYKADLNLGYRFYEEEQYQGGKGVFVDKTVLIIDEAGSLDSTNMYYLLNEANKSGSKVILLGDNNQNPAIGAKGGFSKAGDIAGRVMLTEVNRHKNLDEYTRSLHIEATQALGRYDIARAIAIYNELGAIKIFADEEGKRIGLVNDVCTKIIEQASSCARSNGGSSSDKEALRTVAVGAYTNEEVKLFNEMIRKNLREAGIVKGRGKLYRSGHSDLVELALGDQIIFKSNKKAFNGYGGVDNNEIGVITKLGKVDNKGYGKFKVRVGSDKHYRNVWIRTDDERYPVKFRYGYALTNYALQGVSVSYKYFSIDKNSGYEVFNVGATRHIIDCKFYGAKNTLEDEVYKTQDLDIQRAKEEFKAFAYRCGANGEGTEVRRDTEEVPLWLVGLKLLIAKRADLNFSKAYAYGSLNAVQVKLADRGLEQIQARITSNKEELKESYAALDAMLEGKRDYFEVELEKHFNVDSYYEQFGELRLDAVNIVNAAKKYYREVAKINNSNVIGTGKRVNFAKSLDDHVKALKVGIVSSEGIEKLEFKALSSIDQNIVLRSFLSKSELKDITTQVKQITKLESGLIEAGYRFQLSKKEIKREEEQEGHKMLKGNLGAMKGYLDIRERVIFLQQFIRKQEKILRRSDVQKMVIAEIKNSFFIGLDELEINANDIVRAKQDFNRQYFKEHGEEIHKLRNSEKTQENRKRLRVLSDFRTARHQHLISLVKEVAGDKDASASTSTNARVNANGTGLTKKDKDLLIAHVMDSGISASQLFRTYRSLEVALAALQEARIERQAKALVIVNHYNGYVDNDYACEKMSRLIIQLGCSFETIRKHAGIEQAKHYFEEIETGKTIAKQEDFIKLVSLIELGASKDAFSGSELEKIIEHMDNVDEFIASQKSVIKVKQEAQSVIELEIRQAKEKQADSEEFMKNRLPNYFSKIYKDEPQEVMARLEEAWNKSMEGTEDKDGRDGGDVIYKEFINRLANKPSLLGKVKATNFLAGLFDKDGIGAVRANLEIFRSNIEFFVEAQIMGRAIKDKKGSSSLVEQIAALEAEVRQLKLQLPNREEQELISELKSLRDNGEFDRIGAGKYIADFCKNEQASDILLSFNKMVMPVVIASKEIETIDVETAKVELENDNVNLNNADKEETSKVETSKAYKKAIESNKTESVQLDYNEVKRALSSANRESIFNKYAHNINPDGKIERKYHNIFCGSLNMNLKSGLWHRFSDGSKGDIFKFVELGAGVNKREALEIVASVAGVHSYDNSLNCHKHNIATNIANANDSQNLQKQDKWQVMPTASQGVEKSIIKDIIHKHTGNKFEAIWYYYNNKQELIGATARIIDNVTGKKKVLPIAYCQNIETKQNKWQVKGFTDNGYKPIYRLEKLNDSIKPILIVEGEKTAEKAAELLPEYTVISWMGGAQGAGKVNWQQVADRKVTIWPDNDLAGQMAAKTILQQINKANGFSGFVSVIDVKALNLPEKWDLADALPEGVTLAGIREAIALSENQGKNQNEALAYYQQKACALTSFEEKKLFWQQASLGVLKDSNSISKVASENQVIATCIKHESIISYFAYGSARGRFDASSGFLDCNTALYQEMVSSSVINFLQNNRGTEEAQRICQQLASGNDILAIAKKSLDIYERAINYFTDHKLVINHQFKKDNNELAVLSTSKAELHEFLMKHFSILHQEQLGVSDLSKLHSSLLSSDLAKIIKDYDLHYRGQERVMTDHNRKEIAEIAHQAINSKEWWERLTTEQVKAKFELVNYMQQEVKMTLKVHQEKLRDIQRFEVKFDLEKLREKLTVITNEKLRDQHIEKLWTKVFEDHIAAPMDQLDKQKKEAKTVDEHLAVIKEQKEFSEKYFTNHRELVRQGSLERKDNRIGDMVTLKNVKPDFIENAYRDINHGTGIGLWTTSEALNRLKATNVSDLGVMVDRFERGCSNYYINNITDGLDRIDRLGKVKQDNMEFITHKAYLEHHVNNPVLKPYLQNTFISKKLDDIYKHEAHQQEMQKQQEQLKQQEKALEKDLGKGGFSL